MSETTRSIEATLLTGSLGPDRVTVSIPLPDTATQPPIVIEDPSPGFAGAWRRVSEGADAPVYVRIPRTAAP